MLNKVFGRRSQQSTSEV